MCTMRGSTARCSCLSLLPVAGMASGCSAAPRNAAPNTDATPLAASSSLCARGPSSGERTGKSDRRRLASSDAPPTATRCGPWLPATPPRPLGIRIWGRAERASRRRARGAKTLFFSVVPIGGFVASMFSCLKKQRGRQRQLDDVVACCLKPARARIGTCSSFLPPLAVDFFGFSRLALGRLFLSSSVRWLLFWPLDVARETSMKARGARDRDARANEIRVEGVSARTGSSSSGDRENGCDLLGVAFVSPFSRQRRPLLLRLRSCGFCVCVV